MSSRLESGPRRRPAGTVEGRLPDGELHRENGPAIEHENGTREWWLDGMQVEPFDLPPAPISVRGPRSRLSSLADRV